MTAPSTGAGAPTCALYDVPTAAGLLSIGRTRLYEEVAAGRLEVVKVGRRTLIPAESMCDFVALLQHEARQATSAPDAT